MLAGAAFLDLSASNALAFAVGVGVGIALWFALAATWIDRRRARFSPAIITTLYRGLAVLALILAIAAGISLLNHPLPA